MRSLYELVAQRTEGFAQPQRDEKRLRQALKLGGGVLHQFQDRGDTKSGCQNPLIIKKQLPKFRDAEESLFSELL